LGRRLLGKSRLGVNFFKRFPYHERDVNMDDFPDEATVPSFGPRMRCSRCGKLGATAVPNWIERADTLPGGSRR
jgi:hypothetical protein